MKTAAPAPIMDLELRLKSRGFCEFDRVGQEIVRRIWQQRLTRLLRVALVVTLVAAHSLAFGHTHEFDAPIDDVCAICSVASGLQGPGQAAEPIRVEASIASPVPTARTTLGSQSEITSALPRGPPPTL